MSKSKDAVDAVFKYLKEQNRPYSVNDVVNNLHKQYGKAAVDKAVDTLSKQEKIIEKAYGKQKIYFLNQDNLPTLEEGALQKMDDDIAEMTAELSSLKEDIKSKSAILNKLRHSKTLAELNEEITDKDSMIIKLEKQLKTAKEMATVVKPEAIKETKSRLDKYVNEWKKRKLVVDTCLDSMAEYHPKGKKALMEEIGIESDEDVNLCLKSFI